MLLFDILFLRIAKYQGGGVLRGLKQERTQEGRRCSELFKNHFSHATDHVFCEEKISRKKMLNFGHQNAQIYQRCPRKY